jgi:cation-transporting ATPase E
VEELGEPGEAGTTLIFAYNEEARALDLAGDEWQLPADLTPLGQIQFEERVKAEARDAVNLFGERGVAVKVFTGDEPQRTAEQLRAAGVRLPADPALTAVAGSQLVGLAGAELAEIAQSHSVFGSLSARQASLLVQVLRESGQSVGVAGDSVSDVAALREAELAIVRKDSSPAVLGLGDLVLLDEPSTTLSRVLDKGQRIVNGLVDILKLYLTQIFYLLFLIVAIPLLLEGFPFTSQQAGLVALITLTIPALALTLWAGSGKLPRAKLARLLLNFFVPAALATALLGFLVYSLVLRREDSVAYAQNVLTYAVVLMGLLLVVQIKPPVYFYRYKRPAPGDIRPLLMVFAAVIVFMVINRIPFFGDMFGLLDLQSRADYLLVVGAGMIWIVVVNLFWWLFPVVTMAGEELVAGGAGIYEQVSAGAAQEPASQPVTN